MTSVATGATSRSLVDVFDRMSELGLRMRVHRQRPAPAWVPLAGVPSEVEAAHARAVAEEGDARRAAADLVPWACVMAATPVALPTLLGLGTPRWAGDADIHVRRGSEGWIDAVSVRPAQVAPGSVEQAAHDVVATVRPLVERMTARLPMTATTAWAALLDGLTGPVLWLAADGVADPDETWARLVAFGDELAALAPLRHRPRPFPVEWSGGRRLFHVRVTCCLAYRQQEDRARDGDAYCTTCPLRDDASRQRRFRASLRA